MNEENKKKPDRKNEVKDRIETRRKRLVNNKVFVRRLKKLISEKPNVPKRRHRRATLITTKNGATIFRYGEYETWYRKICVFLAKYKVYDENGIYTHVGPKVRLGDEIDLPKDFKEFNLSPILVIENHYGRSLFVSLSDSCEGDELSVYNTELNKAMLKVTGKRIKKEIKDKKCKEFWVKCVDEVAALKKKRAAKKTRKQKFERDELDRQIEDLWRQTIKNTQKNHCFKKDTKACIRFEDFELDEKTLGNENIVTSQIKKDIEQVVTRFKKQLRK